MGYTEYDIVNSLLDAVNWPAAARDIDNSDPTEYDFFPESGGITQNAKQQIETLEQVCGGLGYVDERGYFKWESAMYRSNHAAVVATFNGTMNGFRYELSKDNIYNRIIVRVRPEQVASGTGGSDDKTWAWRGYAFCGGPTIINPTYHGHAEFVARPDEGEYVSSWGAPSVTARFFTGSPTTNFTVEVVSQSATEMRFNVWQTGSDDIVITAVDVDYTPSVAAEPDGTPAAGGWAEGETAVEAEDTDSMTNYTRGMAKVKEIYVPFNLPYEQANNLAQFYLSYFKDPVPDVTLISLNDDAAGFDNKLLANLELTISDVLTVACARMFMPSTDFFVNRESHEVWGKGLHHRSSFTLEKSETQRQFFIWGTSVWGDGSVWGP